MYALMKANLFVHFPGHVIKYRGFSKRRKKTIDEYLNLQQDGRAMIAWSLNLLRRSVNLVACNTIRNTFSQNDVLCLMSKMIQISTFPAAPSTERVPSLAERVASLRYSINLRFLNNRVPALVNMSRPPFPDSPMCAILAILDQMAAQVGPTFPGNSER